MPRPVTRSRKVLRLILQVFRFHISSSSISNISISPFSSFNRFSFQNVFACSFIPYLLRRVISDLIKSQKFFQSPSLSKELSDTSIASSKISSNRASSDLNSVSNSESNSDSNSVSVLSNLFPPFEPLTSSLTTLVVASPILSTITTRIGFLWSL